MNATRNNLNAGEHYALAHGLGIEPFSARSLVLSILLGLNPPRLPARSMVALGELFDIPAGTTRTALSRMMTSGELRSTDAVYELSGRLLERKAAQDAGRHTPPSDWDGTWWVTVVVRERRSVAERRAFRASMANARMGELRPDTWMRPANLPGPAADEAHVIARSALTGHGDDDLVRRLWDLDALDADAHLLHERVVAAHERLRSGVFDALVDTVLVSAAVVRFLRLDPLLPPVLLPRGWAADELRTIYEDFDRSFGRLLRRFLATAGG
jgi:phenylacetic acid degradation operon negative regulatory protein